MITVKPFKALRPAKNPELTAALPYDVMSTEEARAEAKDNPASFLHIDKPEIDLPPGTDLYAPEVYAKGRENFERFIKDGIFTREEKPCFYVYAQTMNGRTQYGFAAAASTADYAAGKIKKHEFTRKDKEEDRTRHINALNATTGPVFLAYKKDEKLNNILKRISARAPLYNFTSADGITHAVRRVDGEAEIKEIETRFLSVPALYIADGHHRAASAANVAKLRAAANPAHTGLESYNFFLTVIFPAEQLYIMDYNRAVKDLNGLTEQEFIKKLSASFNIEKTDKKHPSAKFEYCLYLKGQWHKLTAKENIRGGADPVKSLDASILQDNILSPLLGINDPRTDKRIDFIGGIRGAAELERYVDGRGYAAAFSMYPTSMEDLMKVADAGFVMPPKSTWFEPKLRSGLLIYKY